MLEREHPSMIADFYSEVFSRYAIAPGVTFPYDLVETLTGTFAGGINKLPSREQWIDEKLNLKSSHRIYCPSNTTIELTDKIKLGTRVFEVRDVDYIEIKSGHHCEIIVEEIK